jgi:hypothetical protein
VFDEVFQHSAFADVPPLSKKNTNQDYWLEVSNRKVLRPATSAQVFLGFPVSKSECSDGSQHSQLLLHASQVALLT